MERNLIKVIAILVMAIIGGWNISSCINSFINGKYFAFGMSLLMALWMAAMIVKWEFTV